jgi:replicative DNA helicase
MKQPDLNYIRRSATNIERHVLGALLLERSAYDEVEGYLSEEDFYDTKNRAVFRAIESVYRERGTADMSLVAEWLRSKNELDGIGGAAYIVSLTDDVASTSNVAHHARIIKQKYIERQVMELSLRAIGKVEANEDVGDVMQWQRREIDLLEAGMTGSRAMQHLSVPVKKAVVEMYLRREQSTKGLCTGIPTGLSDLDRITGGWQRSDLIIVAARPAMGKTAFGLHFARAAAVSGYATAIFSLEMSGVSLANRMLLSESDVSAYRFRTGKISDTEAIEIEKASGSLHGLPVCIDDNSAASMAYIRSSLRLLARQGRCKLAVIDYLQLISGDKNKSAYREQEISKMSREAKRMAKEMDIPVILLSQLNREAEKRSDHRPQLSDLRESGAIEQDADMVCLLHRPEYYRQDLEDARGEVVHNGIEFIIAKYRNGATGSVLLQHDGALNRICDYIPPLHTAGRSGGYRHYDEPGNETGGETPF